MNEYSIIVDEMCCAAIGYSFNPIACCRKEANCLCCGCLWDIEAEDRRQKIESKKNEGKVVEEMKI